MKRVAICGLVSFCSFFAVSLSAQPLQARSHFSVGEEERPSISSSILDASQPFHVEERAVVRLTRASDANGSSDQAVDIAVETSSQAEGASREVQFRPASSEEVLEAQAASRFYHFVITVEGGLVFQSNNDIGVPGGTGSRFDLSDTTQGPIAGFRVYLWWMITQKHSLRLLYAPLSVRTSFTPASDILFDQVSFLAGSSVDALYKFNSYRLSYIYHFDRVGNFSFRLGFTAKIRDAAIELEASDRAGSTTDLGFVPLLNFGVRYDISSRFYIDLDADGSWAPQGRAIDAALKVGYQVHPQVAIETGYRVVEGGADVAQVYNFAWFNSVFFGVSARF
jgi:hypothetical protein